MLGYLEGTCLEANVDQLPFALLAADTSVDHLSSNHSIFIAIILILVYLDWTARKVSATSL